MSNFKSLNRLFSISFILLSVLITVVLVRGDKTFPQVIDTNLEQKVIPLSTNQIVITFNRKMDTQSVETGFQIEPSIPGKFSWIGKKMAYSFDTPLQAGQEFELNLSGAKDVRGKLFEEPYVKSYAVAQKSLYYINQEHRVAQLNFQSNQSTVLTPENLRVTDFKVSKDGELLFFQTKTKNNSRDQNDLYRLNLINKQIEKMVDGSKEFLFSFVLAPNGEFLLVRKGQYSQYDHESLIGPGSLWLYQAHSNKASEFWNKELYGGELYFSPDSQYLVGRLFTGDITITPVEEDQNQVVYLENYAGTYSLSPNGNKLVFVDFEDLFTTHDLLLRTNNGETEKLISGEGQILFPVFNNTGDQIYFLMSKFDNSLDELGYLEFSPYHLYQYDLNQKVSKELSTDPLYLDGFFSVSSDGETIALERYSAPNGEDTSFEAQQENPQAELWIYEQKSGKLIDLGINGTKPHLN